MHFGIEKLNQSLIQAGYDTRIEIPAAQGDNSRQIKLQIIKDTTEQSQQSSEGYCLQREEQNIYRVTGFGDSGVLYGCLELAELVTEIGALPTN